MLHHAFGAAICGLITIVGIIAVEKLYWDSFLYVGVGTVIVFVVSVIKEPLDTKFDWKDILAAMLGCLWVFAAVIIGVLINNFVL